MEKHFREETPLPVDGLPGHFEWWTIGLDADDGNVELFVAYGGITTNDAPIAVMRAAVAKWAEWLATLTP